MSSFQLAYTQLVAHSAHRKDQENDIHHPLINTMTQSAEDLRNTHTSLRGLLLEHETES